MEIEMDPLQKRTLDDTFDAFQMLAGGNFVSLMHVEGGFTRYSRGAVELFGLPGEYIANGAYDWGDYVHPEDRARYLDAMRPLLSGETLNYDLTYRVRIRAGGYISTRQVGAVLRGADGKPSLIGGMVINQGMMENTDPVTVLPNKYAFYDAVAEIMKEDRQAVALLLGVRKLSHINREHSYSYGNRVLQEMAWLIQEAVGQRGSVYRMEDSNFAVLSETLSRDELAAVYDTLRLKLQRGIRVDGARHNLTASGGMIMIQGLHMDPATVYACLNYAYRESKQRRHGELVDFNGSSRYEANEKLEMVNVIRDHIVEGCRGFSLDYQPVIQAATGRIAGAEALVRWEGEPYGRVEPDDFIPVLEKDFVFEELGTWILTRAMTDGKAMVEKSPGFLLSVNVSASQVDDEYFVDSVLEVMDRTGFPAANLCLEITKGCRLLEMERLQAVVRELHSHGIRVGIDDFGTGFESVGFLKRFAADYIKFDRSMIVDIERNAADRETMDHLARCAEVRGTRVIVKGVETPGMRDILQGSDIESMQGNLYSKPVSCRELIEEYLVGSEE